MSSLAADVIDPDVADTFLTCSVCEEPFKNPVGLPCLHSFCKECLTKHILSTTKAQKNPKAFTCPKCKRHVDSPDPHQPPHSWADLFPPNHFVLSLMEGVKIRSDSQKCDPCSRRNEKVIAIRWCKECGEALCQQCEGFHRSMKYSQHHHLVSMEELKTQPIKNTVSRPPCPDHEGTLLGFFCEDHNQVVCSSCVTIDHRKCKHVTTTAEAAEKQYVDAETLSEKLKLQRDWSRRIAENRRHSARVLEDSTNQIRHQITSIRQQINDLLVQKEVKILEELKTAHAEEKEQYDKVIETCDGLVSTTENAIALIQNSMRHGSDTDVILAIDNVKNESQSCENKLADLTTRLKDLFINFSADSTLQAVVNGLDDLGRLTTTQANVNLTAPYNVEPMTYRSDHTHRDHIHHEHTHRDHIHHEHTHRDHIHHEHTHREHDHNDRTHREHQHHESRHTHTHRDDKRREIEIESVRSLPLSPMSTARKSPVAMPPAAHQRKALTPPYEIARSPVVTPRKLRKRSPSPLPPLMLPKSVSPFPYNRIIPRPATLETFFKGRTSNDRENCCFTGADIIQDGRIILCDQTHRKVKVFNHNYQWCGEKVLSAKPYDVCCIGGSDIAVTLPTEKKIQLYTVRDSDFICIANIQTGAKCYGIAYAQKKFAVCCFSAPPSVKLMSRDGRELKTIARDMAGNDYFNFPDYVAMDKNTRNIYVTDRYRKSISCITALGEKRWEIRYDNLKVPRGIAVYGSKVFVAGCRSHTIVQLNIDGDILGDIISEGISYPTKIVVHPNGENILVTQHQATLIDVEKNMVKIFSLNNQ